MCRFVFDGTTGIYLITARYSKSKLGNLKIPKLLRYAPLTKYSFTLVNSVFIIVASLEFCVFKDSLYLL